MTWLWAVIHHGQSHPIVVGIHDLVMGCHTPWSVTPHSSGYS